MLIVFFKNYHVEHPDGSVQDVRDRGARKRNAEMRCIYFVFLKTLLRTIDYIILQRTG